MAFLKSVNYSTILWNVESNLEVSIPGQGLELMFLAHLVSHCGHFFTWRFGLGALQKGGFIHESFYR